MTLHSFASHPHILRIKIIKASARFELMTYRVLVVGKTLNNGLHCQISERNKIIFDFINIVYFNRKYIRIWRGPIPH